MLLIQILNDNLREFFCFSVRISKENCHPDAIRYRTNFKSNRDELSDYLYKLYNENVFDNKLNVPVLWNKKLTKTAGRCKSRSRQGVLSCTIELSDKVVTSCDRLRCTLIHEMCHAATWIFDKETGHGEKWRNWYVVAIINEDGVVIR